MPIPFRIAGQPDLSVEFQIDTGFSGYLSLPPAAVAALGLPYVEDTRANLANDQSVLIPVHMGTIVWNDTERTVRILATGRRPLLGTALLDGLYLGVDFTEGGEVKIEPRS
jgi:clan AA aspartic protease